MSTFSHLIDPVTTAEFDRHHLDKKWLISRRRERSFEHLFSWSQLESFLYVARPWERPAQAQTQLRLVREGATAARASCLEDVVAALSGGATLNLNHVETQWEPLRDLCDALIDELGIDVSANLYCTPSTGAGFATHFDNQDVLVLQISGSKSWRIHPVEVELPFVRQGMDAVAEIAPRPATIASVELELCAGDVLYLPRGTPHDAHATDEASLHVTLALAWPTVYDLLDAALFELALEDPRLRASLLESPTRAEFDELGARLSPELLERARQRLAPRPLGARPERAAPLRAGDVDLDTELVVREGLALGHRRDPHRCVLDAGARSLVLPIRVLPYVEFICRHRRFRPGDLPDELPGNSKLAFAHWLVGRGLVAAHREV